MLEVRHGENYDFKYIYRVLPVRWVEFKVEVDLSGAVTCNCSRCQKLGSTFVFAPAENFTLKSEQDALAEFQFNTKTIRHQFCKTCGIEGFAFGKTGDGNEIVAVKANVLDGFDPRKLDAKHVDGASA